MVCKKGRDLLIPLATLPSKQGLKPRCSARSRRVGPRASCYTSIKTRIETCDRSARTRPANGPSCYTSIKTRIETESLRIEVAKPFSSCYTSIKTRIETSTPQFLDHATDRPLATLPSKQGLKPVVHLESPMWLGPLATLPSKQGLKHTLIMTFQHKIDPVLTVNVPMRNVKDSNKKLGRGSHSTRKRRKVKRAANGKLNAISSKHRQTSCYTSIKTRIETGMARRAQRTQKRPLATLPSKQGLKHGSVARGRDHTENLLLHFHQNKD